MATVMHLSLTLHPLKPSLPLPTHHRHHLPTIRAQAHLPPSLKSLPRAARTQEPTTAKKPALVADHGSGATTCALPKWALLGGISLGVAAALAAAAARPAAAAPWPWPEGPLAEEFWDNMRRYALYALTVSTGVAYAVLQPVVELLKNPVTAVLIVAVVVGSGFLVSQVLNAMVGNSDFSYDYGY